MIIQRDKPSPQNRKHGERKKAYRLISLIKPQNALLIKLIKEGIMLCDDHHESIKKQFEQSLLILSVPVTVMVSEDNYIKLRKNPELNVKALGDKVLLSDEWKIS